MRRWAVGTLVATFLLTGCAKSVAGDASPVAGVATASQRAAEGTNSTDTASTTPAMSEPPTASPTSPTPSATTPSPTATPSPTPSTTSSSPTPSATTPSPTASDSKAATPPASKWLLPAQSKVKAKVNSFGNLVAGLGRPYEVTWNTRKTTALRFIVDSAVVDGRCETPTKPQNGHFLILGVRVQLGDATAEDLGDSRIGFTGENWTAFDARNVADVNTTSSAAGDCITYKTGFPYTSELAPGKVYSGKVALDVSSAKGTVVLMDSVGGGWIYNYG